MPANPVYKFKVELMDTELMIWREFEVTNNIPMSKLGYTLMSIFNMQCNHLFRFIKENQSEPPKQSLVTCLLRLMKILFSIMTSVITGTLNLLY